MPKYIHNRLNQCFFFTSQKSVLINSKTRNIKQTIKKISPYISLEFTQENKIYDVKKNNSAYFFFNIQEFTIIFFDHIYLIV